MRFNLFARAARLLCENHNRSGKLLFVRGAASGSSKGTTTTTVSDARHSPLGSAQTGGEESLADAAAEQQQALPAREPLVKNFFVGITDKELLGYPEVITREEMSGLQNALLPLRNYFQEEKSAPHALDNLRQLGLYRLNVPTDYEGRGYKWSASLIASEPEAEDTSLALGLQSHRVVVDLLCELGTQEQQQRYLPQLGTGQLIATEAIYEATPPEEGFFGTQASYNSETGTWQLSGEKAFVLLAPEAPGAAGAAKQLFLVLAQTQQPNVPGDVGRGSSIFLVDSQQAGVRLGELHSTIGCREAAMGVVHFEQVQLQPEQLLGLAHDGNRLSEYLIRASRLRSSLLGISLAKRLLQQLTNYALDTTQCGVQLKDLELTRVQQSRATCAIYAMESMLYMTAGLLDEFAGQDVTLESAISKYYTLGQLYGIATQNLSLLGPRCLHSGQPAELGLRDAAQLCTQGESLSTLSMFIALTGLQHAGQRMNEGVRRSRNPLYNPGHILGKFLSQNSIEHPKTKMQLNEHVHPTLEAAAQCIEHSVARLHMAVDMMFTQHGNAVVEQQAELLRLANISSTIYAMWASTARASRSYCIGLPLADHEMLTASTICQQGHEDVLRLATEIFNGSYLNNDHNLRRLSKQVAKSKGYFAVHPLTYNF